MSSNDFTERERQLMSLAWQCFDGEPKIDYPKLAGLAGMTNPASASNAWAKIKKKLNAQAEEVLGNDGHSTTSTPAKPTPGKKRGRKPAGGGDENGNTPSKKQKSTESKKTADSGDGDDEEAKETKVKAEQAGVGDDEDTDFL